MAKTKFNTNTARKDSIKIIHLFKTFRLQKLTFSYSERVKRILSSTNPSLERRGPPPVVPKKMLKLHRTRDQTWSLKQQNPRKFCGKYVSFLTSQRETSGKIRLAAKHNLPARKKKIRTNDILHYELKVAQTYRTHVI